MVNKCDLAEAVGADLERMESDARRVREGGPIVMAEVRHGRGVGEVVGCVVGAWRGGGG